MPDLVTEEMPLTDNLQSFLPRPLDEHRREDARGEQEGHDADVDEHGRVAGGDAAGVRVEERVARHERRDGEEAGGDPHPRQGDGRVEPRREAVVGAVQQQGGRDRPRSEEMLPWDTKIKANRIFWQNFLSIEFPPCRLGLRE